MKKSTKIVLIVVIVLVGILLFLEYSKLARGSDNKTEVIQLSPQTIK